MSASIYYQPVKGTLLNIGASSSFLNLLARILHQSPPFIVTDRDSHILSIAANVTEDIKFKAALTELAEVAMKQGEIRI